MLTDSPTFSMPMVLRSSELVLIGWPAHRGDHVADLDARPCRGRTLGHLGHERALGVLGKPEALPELRRQADA